MYREQSVGVVVPAYDEAAFVGDVAREIPGFVDRIYLVDDASTDDTWAAMRDACRAVGRPTAARAAAPVALRDGLGDGALAGRVGEYETVGHVTRLRHDENRGAGGAVKTGYLAAVADDVDVVATVDGDGQMDSALLDRVLDPVVAGRAGYAKGDRFADGGVVGEMPAFRLFGNVLLTVLTRAASGYWRLSDPQNGFTAATTDALRRVDVATLPEYYGYMNDLLARLHVAGVDVADVPMPTTYGDEVSGIDYLQYVRKVSWILLSAFLHRLRAQYGVHPVPAGYLLGAAAVGVGLLRGGLAAVGVGEAGDGETGGEAGGDDGGAVRALLAGVAGLVAATALDRATGPSVVDGGEDG